MKTDFDLVAFEKIPKSYREEESVQKILKDIIDGKHEVMKGYRQLIERLDVNNKDNWPSVISLTVDAGISEDDVSKEIGASASTLSRWKSAEVAPREGTRRLIQRALLALIDEKLAALNDVGLYSSEREKRKLALD